MKFSTAFFALVPLVAALPPALRNVDVGNSTAVISPDTAGNIFVCTDAGFTGSCAVFSGASGQCVDFPSNFNDDISSVGPDSGQDCFFWIDAGCSNEQLGPIRSPGSSNLNVDPTVAFNDHISSFKCFFG
ncbi:hypothetical protein DFH08DRAFT_350047 [Mycena albidolilacea]|uniref:Uncharacterized protein n=1 Tax=Mycena albidolilacea TaxID=1033008 RepID=A0AAD7EI03_9AGAR|nr:hypothetical protein DFH08DRAFT_350047 [Mycena albidolilacea]